MRRTGFRDDRFRYQGHVSSSSDRVVHREIGIRYNSTDADVAIPPGLASAGPGLVPYSHADEAAKLRTNMDELESRLAGLENTVRNHARIQNKLADAIRANGREPLGPSSAPFFNLALTDHDGAFVVNEIKSCTDLNREGQLRLGVESANS